MFKEIDNFKIRVTNKAENLMYFVPNIISIDPLNKLFKATEWLVSEAIKDNLEIKKVIDTAKYASQENIDAVDEMSIRLGSRTQGYINQLCLMEDIFIYEYERMTELITKASGGKIIFNPEEDLKVLKEKFSPIRIFRNKVIAHTAYTKPRGADNPETIVRSILNLFPQSAHITVGDNFFNGFSEYASQLPVLSIFNWESEIKPIFEDWKNLFIEKLKEIGKKCPLENFPYLIEVGVHEASH